MENSTRATALAVELFQQAREGSEQDLLVALCALRIAANVLEESIREADPGLAESVLASATEVIRALDIPTVAAFSRLECHATSAGGTS